MTEKKAHVIGDRERTSDIHVEENVDFAGMYLSDPVLEGLKKSGFIKPSPIQLAAIPLGRCGLDLVVQAKSGTGKTCVFTVVALEMISVAARTTQVLVVAPTREIAVQISQVINSIGSGMPGLRAFTFIGGIPLAQDKAKLGCCHIAVGTPGRLSQLVELGVLKLDNVRLFVLDEADQLLTGQFCKVVVNLISGLPLNKQMLAVSATYTDEVAKVAEELMRSPNHVRLGRDCPALVGVNQFVRLLPYYHQSHKIQQAKMSELLSILSTVTFNQCLVFTNSQLRAESICNQLKATGWPVSYLTGGQAQRDRLQALDALCSYKCRILISTDLSARGLDSEHVNLVINLDMPYNQATYLHRVGRAGRFGSRGGAITLASEGDDWTTMRAIVTLTNVKAYLLQDGWDSNITNKEVVKGLEEVEILGEEALNQWLEVSKKNSLAYQKKKGEKAQKNEMTNGHQKPSGMKLVEETPIKVASMKNSKHEKKGRKSEDDKERKPKKLEEKQSQQTIEENGNESFKEENVAEIAKRKIAEKKAQNEKLVLAMLKRLNMSSSISSFSYSDIYKEVSEKYDSVSVTDSSALAIPPLPDKLNATEQELKALNYYIKDMHDELKAKVEGIDKTWKSCGVDIKEALQAMIEGKDPLSLLQSREQEMECDSHLVDVQNLDLSVNGMSSGKANSYSSSCVDKTESILSEEESKANTETVSVAHESSKSTQQSASSLEPVKNKSSVHNGKAPKSQEKRQKHKKSSMQQHQQLDEQSATRNGPRQKQKKQTRRPSSTSTTITSTSYDSDTKSYTQQHNSRYHYSQQQQMEDWNHMYGSYASAYHPYSQGVYSEHKGVTQGCHGTQNQDDGVHWRQQQQSYNYNTGYPYNWDYYTGNTYNAQAAYIQSAQKFASMMDYVQSMGRMSAWIAQDYHLRCSQSNCDESSKRRSQSNCDQHSKISKKKQ